jgi:flagellar hook-associated protein 3 FlgL
VRVTDRLVFENASRNTGRAREAAQQAVEAASSGMRVQHPGDDPTAAGLVLAHRASGDRFTAIASAAGAASDELAAADSALDGVSTALSRARELAVQLSNSTYSADERHSGAAEVDGLLKQIVSSLNSRTGNRYIFGGSQDDAPPFQYDAGTGAVSYVGANDAREIEIAPGVLQQASVRADVALKGVPVAAGSPPGTDVMQTLQDLRDALRADSVGGVQNTLERLGSGVSQVAAARAQAGVSMSTFDTAKAAAKVTSDQETARAGKLAEVDLAKAAIQLQATQTALEASYAATAQSFRLSILSYLK